MAWKAALKAGLIAVRDGEDYANKRHRYERARDHLSRAYDALIATADPDHLVLAKICLWKGIAYNENMDVRDPEARNDPAIAEYLRGLEHLQKVSKDAATTTRMSLYNSLGVAHHHRVGGGSAHPRGAVPGPSGFPPPAPIPPESVRFYRMARAVFQSAKSKNDELVAIMEKVENNSGRGVLRGGAFEAARRGNYVVTHLASS